MSTRETMLDKEALVTALHLFEQEFGIMAEQYVVSAGAALVLLGLRKTAEDIDVSINLPVWLKITKKEGLVVDREHVSGKTVITTVVALPTMNVEIEIHRDSFYMKMSKMEIDGIFILSPLNLLKEKRELATRLKRNDTKRSQDLKDIKALTKYIKETENARF